MVRGYDVNGIPRVYGEHKNVDVAETICKEEALDYLRKRPDTGPLAKWIFINEAVGWIEGRLA